MHFSQKSLIKVLAATAVYVMGKKDPNVRVASRKLNPSRTGVAQALRAAKKPKANLKAIDAGQAPGDGAKSKLDPAINFASSITEENKAAMDMAHKLDEVHGPGLAKEGSLNIHGAGEHLAQSSLDSSKVLEIEHQRKRLALKSLRGDVKEERDSSSTRQLQATGTGFLWYQLGTDADIVGAQHTERVGTQPRSVSLSANGIVAIGSSLHDGVSTESGNLRVFQLVGSNYVQMGSTINGDAQNDRLGYAVAISDDGLVVAVGAPYHDGSASNAGLVRVFKWEAATSEWSQLGNDIDGETREDKSGFSVAMSDDGSIVAVGAPNNGNNVGHVRVYAFDGTTWVQRGDDIDGTFSNGFAGWSIDLSSDGSILVASAPSQTSADGRVRVYKWNSISYDQRGNDIDIRGDSVAITKDGNVLAASDRAINTGAGLVRVYEWSVASNDYIQRGGPGADYEGTTPYEYFGFSLDISNYGDVLAIGGHHHFNGVGPGHVKIYDYDCSSNYNERGAIDGSVLNDRFGYAVSLSGNGGTLAAASPWHTTTFLEDGMVQMFQDDNPPSGCPTIEKVQSLLTQADDNLLELFDVVTHQSTGKVHSASNFLIQAVADDNVDGKIKKIELAIEALECSKQDTVIDFLETCELIEKALQSLKEMSP